MREIKRTVGEDGQERERERETVCFWAEQIKATAIGCMDAGKNCTLVKD